MPAGGVLLRAVRHLDSSSSGTPALLQAVRHLAQLTYHGFVSSLCYFLVTVVDLGDSSYNMFVDMTLTEGTDFPLPWHHEVKRACCHI